MRFINTLKGIAVVAVLLMLSACASKTIVQTYEGKKLPKESVAVLFAPESIRVVSVNGKRVPSYLLRSNETNYGLLPGPNLVEFHYATVWGLAVKNADNAPRSEEVVSEVKEVLINAEAGDYFTFRVPVAEDRADAKVLAAAFQADIVDADDRVVTSSTELGTYAASQPKPEEAVQTVASPAVSGTVAPVMPMSVMTTATPAMPASVSAAPTGAQGLPKLEAMKVLWGQASKEEKKEFLRWAFQ